MSNQSKSIPALITCFCGQAMAENLHGYTKGFVTPQIGVTQNLVFPKTEHRYCNPFIFVSPTPIITSDRLKSCQY
jgi:hypothetical protein